MEEEPPSMAGRIAAAQAMFSGKHNPFSVSYLVSSQYRRTNFCVC